MENIELIAFNIIAAVGTAKSNIMESIESSRQGDFEVAAKKIKEANEHILTGEEEHFKVITNEAKAISAGGAIALNLLFIHAEDLLMTTAYLRDVAIEMMESHKAFHDLTQRVEALEQKN